MSSGQKAWADECEQELLDAHAARIEAMSSHTIASKVGDARTILLYLISSDPPLSRANRDRLERLEKILKELS